MSTSKILCSLDFPVDVPTRQARIFSKEAIEKACQNIERFPITLSEQDGNSKKIGHITDGKFDGKALNCQGEIDVEVVPSWTEGADGKISFLSFSLIPKP